MSERPRACGAVIRGDRILMVRCRDKYGERWELPGGGIEPGESPGYTAVREVWEEVGLRTHRPVLLWQGQYREGPEYCFAVQEESEGEPALGTDPELLEVAWLAVTDLRDDHQVSRVLTALEMPATE